MHFAAQLARRTAGISHVSHVSHESHRTPRALVLAGMVGLALVLTQIGAATVMAAPGLRYARGYSVQGTWLCYGWSNGIYHCTRHWHRDAAGRLVSDNTRWVPNVARSAWATPHRAVVHRAPVRHATVRHATVRHATVRHATAPRAAASAPVSGGAIGTQGVINEIVAVFGPYAGAALNVARCESGFNTNAYNPGSGASGVFQFLRSTWATTAYAGYSPFNAGANIHAAYQVFARDGFSWREWQCRP